MKYGSIIESHISTSPNPEVAQNQATAIHKILEGKKLHEITDWNHVLGTSVVDLHSTSSGQAGSDLLSMENYDGQALAQWLDGKLGH